MRDNRRRLPRKTLPGKYAPTGSQIKAGPAAKKAPHAISVEDFDLLKVIGKGSFGKVSEKEKQRRRRKRERAKPTETKTKKKIRPKRCQDR